MGTHVGLIEETATEVVSVWEDLILMRKIGPTGIDKVDAGQVILLRDLLGAQMLFDSQGKVGPPLYGAVIADHHALTT